MGEGLCLRSIHCELVNCTSEELVQDLQALVLTGALDVIFVASISFADRCDLLGVS